MAGWKPQGEKRRLGGSKLPVRRRACVTWQADVVGFTSTAPLATPAPPPGWWRHATAGMRAQPAESIGGKGLRARTAGRAGSNAAKAGWAAAHVASPSGGAGPLPPPLPQPSVRRPGATAAAAGRPAPPPRGGGGAGLAAPSAAAAAPGTGGTLPPPAQPWGAPGPAAAGQRPAQRCTATELRLLRQLQPAQPGAAPADSLVQPGRGCSCGGVPQGMRLTALPVVAGRQAHKRQLGGEMVCEAEGPAQGLRHACREAQAQQYCMGVGLGPTRGQPPPHLHQRSGRPGGKRQGGQVGGGGPGGAAGDGHRLVQHQAGDCPAGGGQDQQHLPGGRAEVISHAFHEGPARASSGARKERSAPASRQREAPSTLRSCRGARDANRRWPPRHRRRQP